MANIENVKGGVTANGNEPNNDRKKRKAIPPMWRILGKARKVFDVQLNKTNDVKLKCITNFMNAETQDPDKFWGDFFEQVENLIDSRQYALECSRLGCDSIDLAEHIVFLGSATINKVLKNGIYNTLGNDFRLYKERFSPIEADKYRKDVVAFRFQEDQVG